MAAPPDPAPGGGPRPTKEPVVHMVQKVLSGSLFQASRMPDAWKVERIADETLDLEKDGVIDTDSAVRLFAKLLQKDVNEVNPERPEHPLQS